MAWFVLIASGMLEAVWAGALSASRGFTRWQPVLLFLVSVTLSMTGLAWAMTSLPTGTAYAVWVGIGASLAVLWGFVTGQERATVARVLLLVLLIGSVAGLKAVS
ncbi:DMT family transporter [Brevibacterium ihuae]|uniref:DMT family transporter n=1 Tax=Brevibacterium ihuae TaxID=1631743 RepID=UPI000C77A475|nr:SMR family transporter [Brevibacterium ihuae]